MQTQYAWQRIRVSDFQLAEDVIREIFDPVLTQEDIAPDKALLKRQETEALRIFKKSVEEKEFAFAEDVELVVKSAVIKARNRHRDLLDRDLKFLRGQMLTGADQIHNRYIQLLLLTLELGQQNLREYEERRARASRNPDKAITVPSLTFAQNPLLAYLSLHEPLQQAIAKYGLSFEDGEEKANVKRWFRELAELEFFAEYQKKDAPSEEEHREVLLQLIKHFLFKNQSVGQYFEDLDLNWEENAEVLRSMLRKTIKSLPVDPEDSFELIDLSPNWEEDRMFFEELFDLTLEEDERTDTLVGEHAKNWELDRIAATDKIILKMAVTEMLHFPSVPVKVTINEYIEISKQYSTPKSKHFVNGMLDVIAEHLKTQGLIRKSGRGLIDNK